ncbi:MAG: hypothetical protein PHH48_03555 [Eubacteriales bacterium]|nr:hypothetical protein [Eubacteriales bacterium]
MLRVLIITRFKAMLSGMFKKSRGGKGRKTIGKTIFFIIVLIYVIGCFGILFGGMFMGICDPFASLNLQWFYFGFMGILVFLLCFVGSVFTTQNQIYEAKDNDLLLSMPIPPKYILASRLLALLGLNYIYEILVILPGAVVYIMKQPVTLSGVVIFIISFLLLPLLVMAFSALFGWLIAFINSKMRNKTTVITVFTLVLFLSYMYACFKLQDYMNILIQRGAEIGEAVKRSMPPFYYMGTAIADGNWINMLIFVLCCIIPFGVVYYVLSSTFIKIATSNKGHKKIKYKERSMKVKGTKTALINKEISHFTQSPMYMFNAGIGLVFMPIGAIALAFKYESLMATFQMMGLGNEIIGALVCAGLGAMCSMVIISAPTISIEGKTFWICQSAPILDKDVLITKAMPHIILSLPFIIVSALIAVIFVDMNLISIIMVFLLPIAITVFNALFGVLINLKFPKFDWINEIVAIKQGAAPMIAMFTSMATIALPMILYMLLLHKFIGVEIYLIVVFGFFVALAALCYWLLVNTGVRMYRQLAK